MKINLSGPDITEAEITAVTDVLRGRQLSLGPRLTEFEGLFTGRFGRRFAVAVNSGTSALQLCLQAMGVGPGDEVITTPFSFIATSNVILMVGATPVFVDIDPASYNITAEAIARKITPRTKAVIPVEVFGNPAGLDAVYDLALSRKLWCLEDCCEALGSEVNGKKCGTLGHAGTFAFYPNKQITTGEGGIILTDDEHIARTCAALRNQGRDGDGGWLAHQMLGYNYRLSDINCALGIAQMKRLDEILVKRARVAGWYHELLAGDARIILPPDVANGKRSWFVYVIRLADDFPLGRRDQIINRLREQGIGCSNYFTPIHLQPFMVKQFGYKHGDFPITEHIGERTIALPFYNNLSRSEVETVCKALREALD